MFLAQYLALFVDVKKKKKKKNRSKFKKKSHVECRFISLIRL